MKTSPVHAITKTYERDGKRLNFFVEPHQAGVFDEVVLGDCYKIDEVPEGSTVIDIGANVGMFSVLCAFFRECRVYAFEPSVVNYGLLTSNASWNDVSDRIISFQAAVGRPGIREFLHRTDHPVGSCLIDGRDPEYPGSIYKVICVSLKDIICGLDKDLVIKMDCEGAEYEIFEDVDVWSRQTSRVMMEYHNHDYEHFSKKLSDIGFDILSQGDATIGGGIVIASRLR